MTYRGVNSVIGFQVGDKVLINMPGCPWTNDVVTVVEVVDVDPDGYQDYNCVRTTFRLPPGYAWWANKDLNLLT